MAIYTMQSEKNPENLQHDFSNEKQIPAKNYCLKCSAELSVEQTHCKSCATEQSPLKHAQLLVILLISISFVIGFILIITA
jgi:ribosomal protein L40E